MSKKTKKKKTELRALTATNSLIGARLISISDTQIVCEKDGKIFTISTCAEGSYSDWWDVNTTLLISKKDLRDNPIITKVEQNDNTFEFVLFGAYRPLAKIGAEFHNASDWDYGCTCRIYVNDSEAVCWWG